MGFVVGVVAALLVIFLLTYITLKKPVFGRVLIALSVVMIALSVFFYFQKDERVEKQKSLIPPEQIILSDISYAYAYGSFYKLTATVENRSERYRLQAILLNISFFQCKQSNTGQVITDNSMADCQLVKSKEIEVKTRLAPKKTGQLESYVLLDKEGDSSLQWQVKLVSGIAR
jgi:prepilin signal peptidase PulO-like enzyme (type II secretory pathway)